LKVESLRKSVCKGNSRDGASVTHTPTYYPIFAQQFAQLALNLFLICIYVQHNAQTN